jgi:hypothetical protein
MTFNRALTRIAGSYQASFPSVTNFERTAPNEHAEGVRLLRFGSCRPAKMDLSLELTLWLSR